MSFDYSYFNDNLGKMTKEEYNEAVSKGERMNRPVIVIEDREDRSHRSSHVLTERTG